MKYSASASRMYAKTYRPEMFTTPTVAPDYAAYAKRPTVARVFAAIGTVSQLSVRRFDVIRPVISPVNMRHFATVTVRQDATDQTQIGRQKRDYRVLPINTCYSRKPARSMTSPNGQRG